MPRRERAGAGMRYKWRVLSNTTVATLMAAIDTNIVLIALPTIGRDLPDTTATDLLWVLIGYSLLTATVLLNFGRLSDLFGRVRLYVLGFAVFTVGSLLCGLSQTGIELVVFRLVQAVGAGFLFANSAAIITDAFPAGERGTALGINQVSIVAGAVVGLVIGGFITATLGWRWVFFVNVPIGLLATVRARLDLRELAAPEQRPRIDWAGNLVFAGGLTALLLGVTLGALAQIPVPTAAVVAVLGASLLVAFPLLERTRVAPMLDLALFRNRVFSGSVAAMLLNALARGAFTFVLVFYLQGPPRFLSALTAGLFLLPTSASLAVVGPISGWLSDRKGSTPFLVVGLALAAAGFLWLTQIPAEASFAQLAPALVMVGAGMGFFASPNRAAMMTAVPADRRGVASGVGTTLINSGTTLSLGLTIALLAAALPGGLVSGILLGTEATGTAAAGFLNAIHLVFLISAVLCLVAIGPSLLRGDTRVGRSAGGSGPSLPEKWPSRSGDRAPAAVETGDAGTGI